jgi:hypothetical protein
LQVLVDKDLRLLRKAGQAVPHLVVEWDLSSCGREEEWEASQG